MKNSYTSLLFQKPLKELPRRIVYKIPEQIRVQNNLNCQTTYVNVYNMFDTQTKEIVGSMTAAPVVYRNPDVELYPIPIPYRSFYISKINIDEKRRGHGSAFIKIARAESKRENCQGRVHLLASRIFSPNNPPHLFYRKKKFVSESPYLNSVMDFYISIKEPLPIEYADNIAMYLPLEVSKNRLNFKISKIFNFIKEKFAKI